MVNAGKSKVMVGSSGGNMIVISGKRPGVCGKGVKEKCSVHSMYKMDSKVMYVVTCRW